MNQLGSIMLIAGTAIGSGMIALPMALSKLGIVPSIALMLMVWSLMYYTSLVNLELNLQAGVGSPLGALGKKFSGSIAAYIGVTSFKLLSYALLSAYLYGGTSVMQRLLASKGYEYSFIQVGLCYTFCISALLISPVRFIDYTNRFLFVALLAIIGVLICGLMFLIEWDNLPLTSSSITSIQSWTLVVPIIFCSFGFQVIFHTLTNYCDKNPVVLKKAFFWGSLIPAIVYTIWTVGVLSILYHKNPNFYADVMSGKSDVGDMIQELSKISSIKSIQLLSWWISVLAIVTSVLGVGLGLVDTLRRQLKHLIKHETALNSAATILALAPAYLIAHMIPGAFIKIFAFAGMILVVIAIFLPIYLLYAAKPKRLFYKELSYHSLRMLAVIAGVVIVACEFVNILG